MERYLNEEEVNELISRIRSGDDKAWEQFFDNFKNYVYECAWKRLRGTGLPVAGRKELVQELTSAGWQGFVHAVRNYAPDKGKFLTYATEYIDGEISKELDFYHNPLGLKERPEHLNPEGKRVKQPIRREYIEDENGNLIPEAMAKMVYGRPGVYVDDATEIKEYSAERRILQYLDVLKLLSDEDHKLSKEEFTRYLYLYRIAKYGTKYGNKTGIEAPNTMTRTIEEMITELDPLEYKDDLEGKYKIKYEGYKEDRIRKRRQKKQGGKSAPITDLSYSHTFSSDELDRLIQLVCFSDMLDADEKGRLIEKLIQTASLYYRTPFWDGTIRFDPKAVHGRFSARHPKEKVQFVRNLKTIQYAVNNLVQIGFKFDHYTEDHRKVPKSELIHVLSPYHLVVYHDNYYCIGLKKDDRRIWHYRVDLMSEVEILRDDAGSELPIEVSAFEGNPICNAVWDPEKYMAEHLNMAYDEPRDIRIRIRNNDYTILHDWFGDHYEKIASDGEDDKGNKYDLVKVKTSPSMIVHWAMQYGARVEIMDDEIREQIRKTLKEMEKQYE